jgi:flagellin
MSAASLGVGSGNAVASATAASLSTVGGNVLQVSGSAVSGDVFTFDLNGDTFAITIGDINSSGDIDYTFTQKTGSTSVDSSGGTFDTGASAAILGDTASVIAAVLTEAASGGGMNGLTATAAADGSVTITQSATVTAANYNDGASADSGDGVVSVSGATTSIKFASGGLSALAAGDEFNFTIEGATVTFTDAAGDIYDGTDLTGYIAGLQAQVDASTELKGYTVSVNSGGGDDLIIDFTKATTIANVSTTNAAATSALDITSSATSVSAITAIDTAIQTVNSQRASLGAVSNRLDSTVSNLTNISNNLQAGRGRIEDADFAAETTNLAKTQILQQASTAMLAQANAAKQNVLSLLQG